jgi:hypothetical protein
VITAAGKNIRHRIWNVYGAAIQSAIGDRLSVKEANNLATLLGTLIERSDAR